MKWYDDKYYNLIMMIAYIVLALAIGLIILSRFALFVIASKGGG